MGWLAGTWVMGFVGTLVLSVSTAALAGGHLASEQVKVLAPWSRALPSVAPNGAAYMTVRNVGVEDARIVEAHSPVARHVELHRHTMEDGLAKMRKVEHGVVVPAQASVSFAPGGLHIMLMGLREPLTAGMTFPLTLRFHDGGESAVVVAVLSSEDAMKRDRTGHSHGGKAMAPKHAKKHAHKAH